MSDMYTFEIQPGVYSDAYGTPFIIDVGTIEGQGMVIRLTGPKNKKEGTDVAEIYLALNNKADMMMLATLMSGAVYCGEE